MGQPFILTIERPRVRYTSFLKNGKVNIVYLTIIIIMI
jgi:hypothetical protein